MIPHRHHPPSLRSLRRQHWIKWLQITTVFLWSLFPPFYTPAPAAYTPDSQSPPQPVWDGNGDEPESGPDLSDDDSDGLPNWFEQWLGSDIGNPDSDYDGLSDADEQYLTGTDPINWDSNNDGYSDHDAFYRCWAVNHNTVGFGQSVYDWDGDGIYNPQDAWPLDANNGAYDPNTSDSDGDGYADANDSHPYDSSVSGDWGTGGDSSGDPGGDPDPGEGNPEPTDDDADDDGYPDGQDSDPNDSTLWDDANRNGINDSTEIDPYTHDSDGDTIVDAYDSHPWDSTLWADWNSNNQNDHEETSDTGTYDYDHDGVHDSNDSHPSDSTLWADWNNNNQHDPHELDSDGDSVSDLEDTDPHNSALWNDHNRNGLNDGPNDPSSIDTDLDGVPDMNDSHPDWDHLWNDFNENGFNDDHPTDDQDGDTHSNETDSHPSNIALWEDWDNNGINDSEPDGIGGGGGGYDDADSDNYPNHLDSHPHESTLWSDWDFDSLNLDEEMAHQTDPERPDTDQDGLSDGEEVSYSTSPTRWDTDDDGLSDFEELRGTFGSNPRDAYSLSKNRGWGSLYDDWQMASPVDTDLDGIPNRIEELYGLNPNNPLDASSDLDGDGIINRIAYQQGKALLGIVTPLDRDGDGLTDAQEDFWGRRNPGLLSKFNPSDAVKDPDNDDLMNWQEVQFNSNPGIAVSTPHGKKGNVNDGTVHFWQSLIQSHSSYHSLALTRLPQGYHGYINEWMDTTYDTDDNGSPDITPAGLQAFLDTVSPIDRRPGRKAPGDYDGDGMPDQWEWRYRPTLNVLNPADAGTQSQPKTPITDPDSDALCNLMEFQLNTHPLIPDTDGDGYPDGLEFESGSTPTNPGSLPSITIALSSGNSQTIPVQSVTPQPLTVAARRQNSPAPGTPITFTHTSPTGGQISTSPNGPWQAAVTILSSSSGNSQVYWKAPATPGSSTILATLPGTPSQSPITFTLNAIDPPPNPPSPGGAPGTTPPSNNPPPPPPDGVYIFTSERYITGSFNGRSGGEEVISETTTETMQTGEEWYLTTPIPRPPRQSNDGFNGDADAAENLTDPLDPRDENLANAPVPPIRYRRTPAEHDTPGAQMINETYEVTRYTGNHSVNTIQPSGNYRAHNDITAIPPANQNQTNSGTLQSTTLTGLMNGMPWMQGSNPQHGWRGDGNLGVRAKSANVSWNEGTHTVTYTLPGDDDPDGNPTVGGTITKTSHYQTASARHTQVRLQSSKPVIAEAGASRNFVLIKTTTTLPDSPNGPAPQVQTLGTITLKIPKNGTLSTTATPSSPSLAPYIKNQDNMAYIELRPTEFTLNQKISLSLLPIDIDALEPTEGISDPKYFPEAPEGSDAVVALNFDDDDEDGGSALTPDSEDSQVAQEDDLLPIKLHRLELSGQTVSFKLKFDSQYVKIWKKADKTEAVTSDSTELDGSQDIVVFAEGIKITPAVNSNEEGNLITQRVKIGTSGTWSDGEKLKTRVGRPIVPVFGAISIGGTLAGNGAYIPVIFPEVGVSGEADLKTYLQGAGKKRSRFSSSAYVVKGKDAQGKEQNYTVELRDSEKVLKMALQSEGADVAINSHANMGLGPAFKTGLNAISDFTNLSGLGKASIHVLSLRQHNNHPALALGNDVINAPTNNNLPVLNRLRFLNNGNIGNGQAFTLQGQGDGRYHYFDTENGLNQVVVTSTGDVPQQLKYRSLFIDSCSSGPHFIESFQHGMFIYTTRACGEPENIKIFVEGIIKGQTGNAIAAELNGNSTMGAVYSAHQF